MTESVPGAARPISPDGQWEWTGTEWVARATQAPASPVGQVSPDGHWQWEGQQWQPRAVQAAPQPAAVAEPAGPVAGQLSPDGASTWNGTMWVPRFAQSGGGKVKKKHTVRNVLLAITGLFVLSVGGCMALIGGAAHQVDKSIKADASKPGGTDNPLTIVPGRAFAVDGFRYAAGWKVGKDVAGDVDIRNLKVTNRRTKKDSALVEIKLWRGTEVIASADCTTAPIAIGTTVTLSCTSADKLPRTYSRITINDSF